MCNEFGLSESLDFYTRASKYTCLNVKCEKKKIMLQGGFQPDFYKFI
jgi:hypothetical protein